MSGIIEKLGVKSEYKPSMVNGSIILKLEKQRNGMLEWLIRDLHVQDLMNISGEKTGMEIIREKYGDEIGDHLETMYQIQKELIENSIEKTWEEVKELLK